MLSRWGTHEIDKVETKMSVPLSTTLAQKEVTKMAFPEMLKETRSSRNQCDKFGQFKLLSCCD